MFLNVQFINELTGQNALVMKLEDMPDLESGAIMACRFKSYLGYKCSTGETGRHVRLKIECLGVQVRILGGVHKER